MSSQPKIMKLENGEAKKNESTETVAALEIEITKKPVQSISADGICHFLLPRKNRRCRTQTKADQVYYSERVVCPLDPKHTVASNDLAKHVAFKCNARVQQTQDTPWIVQHFNRVTDTVNNQVDNKCPVTKSCLDVVNEDWMMHLVDSIVLPMQSAEVPLTELQFDICDQAINDQTNPLNDKKIKHLRQQSSLIGHVLKLIKSETDNQSITDQNELVIVEFGAGHLSNHVHRVRCDIEHLRLSHVSNMRTCRAPAIVGLCKHLCGAGTDLAIRCALNLHKSQKSIDNAQSMSDQSTNCKLVALALAPCCHHRCEWTQFCGQQFLSRLGVDSEEKFSILRKMVSWATCAFKLEKMIDLVQREKCAEKERIGRKVQLMFELARMDYLRGVGFGKVQLIRYVPLEVTPQNYLIIASLTDC